MSTTLTLTMSMSTPSTRQLLAKGCEVVATHRGSAPPSELAALADVEQRLTTMSLDVSDPVSVSAASEQLRSSGSYIDAVIHNAGVYGPTVSLDGVARNGRAGARPVTREDLLSVFETNAVGPLLVAQALAPLLEAQRESEPGKALPVYAFLTSKVGSVEDNGSGGAYAYRASKSALNIVAKVRLDPLVQMGSGFSLNSNLLSSAILTQLGQLSQPQP